MSEATLRRNLTIAKNNPDDPSPYHKAGSRKNSKFSPAIMIAVKTMLMNKPNITTRKLKDRLHGLADVSARTI
jgi:hypothetical protein